MHWMSLWELALRNGNPIKSAMNGSIPHVDHSDGESNNFTMRSKATREHYILSFTMPIEASLASSEKNGIWNAYFWFCDMGMTASLNCSLAKIGQPEKR